MKTKHLFLATAALAATLTSCNNGYKVDQSIDMLNVITVNGQETYSLGVATWTQNSDADADVLTLYELPGTDDFSSTVKFENIRETYKDGSYSLSLTETSSISGCSSPSSFSAVVSQYGNFDYAISLNSGAKLYGICNGVFYFSNTFVTLNNRVVASTSDSDYNSYRFEFNEKDLNTENRTLNIYIYNTKFSDDLSSMTMIFNNIPFSIKNGNLTFSSDAFTPNGVSGYSIVTLDSYAITNLSGSGRIGGSDIYLSFDCTYTDKSGNSSTYTVSSTLVYTPTTTSSN